jgi:hypothetical protein
MAIDNDDMTQPVWYEPEIINGFLWVGDQHLGTRRPERRYNDYNERILAKIQKAIDIANEKKLVLLFAGDLFHHEREEDDSIKTVLNEMFSDCWIMPIFNIGNHDKRGLLLSKKDSLSVIASSKFIRLAYTTGPVAVFTLSSGRKVMIGASPYDMPIPTDISDMEEGVDRIWMTHHDMAFDGVYPGATELHEIKGCRYVMNGHMHLHRAPTPVGKTLWCNFGSIARTAIDAINETPAVWEINEDTFIADTFERHVLPHQPGPVAFDLTGHLIPAAPVVNGLEGLAPSSFIEILKTDMTQAQVNVDQEGVYEEELTVLLDKMKASQALRQAILQLRIAAQNQGYDTEETPPTPKKSSAGMGMAL